MTGPLLLRQLIPPLTARTGDGKTIRAWDYKQKRSLVIVFLHADCPHCDDWLGHFAARAADLIERDAVVLLIYAEPPPRKTETMASPLIPAADAAGHSQRAFLGPDAFGSTGLARVGVFITDRYGELYGQWTGRDAGDLPAHSEILDTLTVIQMIC